MNRNRKSLYLLFSIVLLATYSCSNRSNNTQTFENVMQKEEYDSLRVIKGAFDIPEISVAPSPNVTKSLPIPGIEKIIGYDVSPAGPIVAMIVEDSEHKYCIKFWQITSNSITDSFSFPEGYTAEAVVWHPRATALFAIGVKEKQYAIFKIEKVGRNWTSKSIFSSSHQLKKLIACPRPFIVGGDYNGKDIKEYYSYRIFFGMDNGDNSFRIVSITETGKRFYQVIGPAQTISHFEDADMPPSTMESAYALPVAFHPAGHQLIWENKKHDFFVANYDYKYWGEKYKSLTKSIISIGTVVPTPNGLGLLHWQKGKPGIGVYLLASQKEEIQAQNYNFVSTPYSVPDGKGIVGLTKTTGKYVLNYVPVNVPLADVVNFWMFSETPEETNLLQNNYGLFRTTTNNQLYELYDSENYGCGDYDRAAPTRPYLVTTDIFWELFGAAYQGLFIVKERDQAIPNFWKFITAADQYYKMTNSNSKWTPVFNTLTDLHSENNKNPEVIRIQNTQNTYSDLLKKEFDYSELKPRGYYTSTPEMQKYFMAFRYFTTIYEDEDTVLDELNLLPSDIRNFAVKWIESYNGFISPSRSPLVWKDIKSTRPAYNQYPGEGLKIFPLSWGFDNEVLYSTVFHSNLPVERQITGANGPRILPSGLDLASALGNRFADSLLKSDYVKYPPLRKVIENLKDNFKKNGTAPKSDNNLYDRWINAIAVQWADTVTSANGNCDKNIWQVKRLQTGLSTWATLRHATGLVNERGAAECGEGGFEEILLRAPRGYVEPDPYTFSVIADLFETAIKYVSDSTSQNEDINQGYSDQTNTTTLYDGIVKRLKEAAQDARAFQGIAEKEKKGEVLTNEEYEKILYIGRVAEHGFLIFKSLSNKDYALSTPDPVAKVTDVFGNSSTSYLMAAVGNPLEWDYVVPFYGRHQIVKGSIYAYYEFSSSQLLNGKEWNEKIKSQAFLPWLNPYITTHEISYPAVTGY